MPIFLSNCSTVLRQLKPLKHLLLTLTFLLSLTLQALLRMKKAMDDPLETLNLEGPTGTLTSDALTAALSLTTWPYWPFSSLRPCCG